ncbi:MAG: HNH endonuclease [Firmicutes bacterium]|jgi:5-methylcytosine-specific restriction protein A|nr:HNH endonuclease [Bacillota bacterium]
MIWMISANGNMYDHASSFATNGFIDWRQRAKYSVGDIVYIYCTRPFKRVMYKCEVTKHSVPFSECIDDAQFWIDHDEYEKSKVGLYARLKLLDQVDTNRLSLESPVANGLSAAPQGPVKVSPDLHAYIDSQFNDYYSDGFFTDVNEQEQYHEGHIRSVKVDRYERSSIARRKCIEHHGTSCIVCGLNFGDKYGALGEGFIHIHHLRPLHTIKRDYVVDYKQDLIPVCPNCHAMIHRIPGGETMSVKELRKALKNTGSKKATSASVPSVRLQPKIDITPHATSKTNISEASEKHYVGQRVFHINAKFGPGIVKSETDTTVNITFDNGISTSFTKESFAKGLLQPEK